MTQRNYNAISDGDATAALGASPPVFIATCFRAEGRTGVHTHIRQWRCYLERHGTAVKTITSFSWNRPLTYPVFGPRLLLKCVSKPASVAWYRHWHEAFLRNGLRRALAQAGPCVVYAQGPLEARAALGARRGRHQRVIMAVHFRSSQADEYSEPGREIRRGSTTYHAMRAAEREVIMRLDGIVYVSEWARQSLLSWLPEAAAIRSAVISNAVAPVPARRQRIPLADLVTVGRLDEPKNHRFILEVLARANGLGRRITLHIYGDGPLRNDLKHRISLLGLAGQVRLLGFRENVRAFLPSYLAYVHASYLETSSLAIIEAMAAGLPIVAGGIGPVAELCDDGVEARFWPLADPARSAEILVELLESEAVRSTASRAATDRFVRDYHIDAVGARMRSFMLET